MRSLNVRVSGAIAVWMCARQVLLKAAGPAGGVDARLAGVDAELAAVKATCQKQVMELGIAQKEVGGLKLTLTELISSLPEKYRKHLEEDSRQTPPPPPRKSSKTSSEGH